MEENVLVRGANFVRLLKPSAGNQRRGVGERVLRVLIEKACVLK
jgi:hypothetical protein